MLEIHFESSALKTVRIRKVNQLENPSFYTVFAQMGEQVPLNFRQMAGITFLVTIVIAEPKVTSKNWLPLLFHECVRVCQYSILGADTFIDRYI